MYNESTASLEENMPFNESNVYKQKSKTYSKVLPIVEGNYEDDEERRNTKKLNEKDFFIILLLL